MPKIAVDIDDTLYSFSKIAREEFADIAVERGDKEVQRGAYCAWVEWRSPADVCGLDLWMEVIDRCHAEKKILAQTPFDGAADTLWELHRQGYELLYISNRSVTAEKATEDWLYHNDFPQSGNLICTMDDKTPYVKGCQYLIDDRPKTLVQFVYDYNWKLSYGGSLNEVKPRKGFGLFGEYNRSLTDVPGVWLAPNWKLMRHYLIAQGVLKEAVPA